VFGWTGRRGGGAGLTTWRAGVFDRVFPGVSVSLAIHAVALLVNWYVTRICGVTCSRCEWLSVRDSGVSLCDDPIASTKIGCGRERKKFMRFRQCVADT